MTIHRSKKISSFTLIIVAVRTLRRALPLYRSYVFMRNTHASHKILDSRQIVRCKSYSLSLSKITDCAHMSPRESRLKVRRSCNACRRGKISQDPNYTHVPIHGSCDHTYTRFLYRACISVIHLLCSILARSDMSHDARC